MPNPLQNKKIILGVTGSIAAYKAADIASKLTQASAMVDVVLTESALQFLTPLTFQSVTARRAYTDADLWGGEGHVTHIGLGHSADLLLIAPASANTMAKLAQGIGDNLLTVTALAADCPLMLAPAMDAGMFAHPATQANVDLLRQRGALFIGPAAGHLASGLVGVGRMSEPSEIIGHVRYQLSRSGPLAGRTVVVTAGGTQEPIDPVRIITNRSSGKQGFALAQAALDAGANVILISGPSHQQPPIGVTTIAVATAAQMLDAVMEQTAQADLLIMAAAVADFTPVQQAAQKIKKDGGIPEIQLEPTADVLAAVAHRKIETGFPRRIIGFAAESQDLLENARRKLDHKQLDLIAANDITAQDAGFDVDTNRVVLLSGNGASETLPILSKAEVADHILQRAMRWF